MIQWADAHNHLQDDRLGDPAPLIQAMVKSGVSLCVVNATREENWQMVADLADEYPDFIRPAFGIHPWYAHTAQEGWQERLADILTARPMATVGECGLDRWIESPGIEIQMPVFLDQLKIAREWSRPITIHCLKAWGPLFEAFDRSPPPDKFLMHSFGGSIETAERLTKCGAYFSFSGYFLQPRKASVVEVFCQLPRKRLLLETDAPDMLPPEESIRFPLDGKNHPANLPAIGEALAERLEMTAEDLAVLTRENLSRFLEINPAGAD